MARWRDGEREQESRKDREEERWGKGKEGTNQLKPRLAFQM